jgi:hypothetical protein
MAETTVIQCSEKGTNRLELCGLGENLCILVDETTATGGEFVGKAFVFGNSAKFLVIANAA